MPATKSSQVVGLRDRVAIILCVQHRAKEILYDFDL